MPMNDLGAPAYIKHDIETFIPSRGWCEISSASNCTDYQSRRLNIRHRLSSTNKLEFVHTVNGTAVAIPRLICAILENWQTRDGDVVVPEVLEPWMMGIKTISLRKMNKQ